MSKDLTTIKELADELGVSKQAIRKYFDKLPADLVPKKERGTYLLNQDIQNFIKNKVKSVDSSVDTSKQSVDSSVDTSKQSVDSIKDELILDKNIQIEYFKTQIDNLIESQKKIQNLLDQQQRLSLQDKKLLEEYKSEIKDLKALKLEIQSTQVEQAVKQPQKMQHVTEDLREATKKWWQFWK